MFRTIRNHILGCGVLVVAASGAAHAADLNRSYEADASSSSAKSIVTFSGADWAKDASYFYSGAILALNRDISRDGFRLRGFAGVPLYEYRGDDWTKFDGDGVQADVMIGYSWIRPFVTFSAYIGVDYQDYDITPHDPHSKVTGSETGFKVSADLTSAYDSPFYFNFIGSYSTAFDSYWTRGRIGYNSGRFVIGPEAIAMGNDGFRAHRFGGFASIRMELTSGVHSEISAHVGHQWVDEDKGGGNYEGGEGTYGGVGFSLVF